MPQPRGSRARARQGHGARVRGRPTAGASRDGLDQGRLEDVNLGNGRHGAPWTPSASSLGAGARADAPAPFETPSTRPSSSILGVLPSSFRRAAPDDGLLTLAQLPQRLGQPARSRPRRRACRSPPPPGSGGGRTGNPASRPLARPGDRGVKRLVGPGHPHLHRPSTSAMSTPQLLGDLAPALRGHVRRRTPPRSGRAGDGG